MHVRCFAFLDVLCARPMLADYVNVGIQVLTKEREIKERTSLINTVSKVFKETHQSPKLRIFIKI